jgi:hypothetical protein
MREQSRTSAAFRAGAAEAFPPEVFLIAASPPSITRFEAAEQSHPHDPQQQKLARERAKG